MPVSCQEILDLANIYYADCDTECKRRGVVGRSYYAAYHKADAFHKSLPQPGTPASGGGMHKQLWSALSNPTVADANLKFKSKQIGYICKDLHAKRVIADYELNETVGSEDVEQAMLQAKRIFELTE